MYELHWVKKLKVWAAERKQGETFQDVPDDCLQVGSPAIAVFFTLRRTRGCVAAAVE